MRFGCSDILDARIQFRLKIKIQRRFSFFFWSGSEPRGPTSAGEHFSGLSCWSLHIEVHKTPPQRFLNGSNNTSNIRSDSDEAYRLNCSVTLNVSCFFTFCSWIRYNRDKSLQILWILTLAVIRHISRQLATIANHLIYSSWLEKVSANPVVSCCVEKTV